MTATGLSLENYLGQYCLSIESITAAIEAQVGLGPDDVAYITGSLVEGLGNRESDIDVILLTVRNLEEHKTGSSVVVPCGERSVDLRPSKPTQAEEVISKLASRSADSSRDPRGAFSFTDDEQVFLHRLRIGRPIAGHEAFERLRRRIDTRALATLKFQRAFAAIAAMQIDLVGLFDSGDAQSALYMSQSLLGCVADAVLAAQGETNPSPKWRLRLLRNLHAGWDATLPGGPLPRSAADFFFHLYNPEELTFEGLKAHAHECTMLANRIIPWAQRVLPGPIAEQFNDSAGRVERPERPRTATTHTSDYDGETVERALPHLALDVQLRWAEGELKMFRCTGAYSVTISPLTHEALLRFDGRTTLIDAARQLSLLTSASEADLVRTLIDVRRFLEGYSFLDTTGASVTDDAIQQVLSLNLDPDG